MNKKVIANPSCGIPQIQTHVTNKSKRNLLTHNVLEEQTKIRAKLIISFLLEAFAEVHTNLLRAASIG